GLLGRRLAQAFVDQPHHLHEAQGLRAVAEDGLHLAHEIDPSWRLCDRPRRDSARSIRSIRRAFSSGTGPVDRPTTICTTTRRTATASRPQYSFPSFTFHIVTSSAGVVGGNAIPSPHHFSCRLFPLPPHYPGGGPVETQRHERHRGRIQPGLPPDHRWGHRSASATGPRTAGVQLRGVPGPRAWVAPDSLQAAATASPGL